MEEITASWHALLRQHFHITPTTTSRHDQWFKRRYNFWKAVTKDQDLLILTPTVSKDEWATDVLRLSAQLSSLIVDSAATERCRLAALFAPSAEKLFPDSALDEPPLMGRRLWREDDPTVCPQAQRAEWWPAQPLLDRAYCTKALLERDQLSAVLYLAKMRGVALEDAEDLKGAKHGKRRVTNFRNHEPDEGWGTTVDEALEIFFLCVILGTFPEELLAKDRSYETWQNWLPLWYETTPARRFLEALEQRQDGRFPRSRADLKPHAERCLRILVATHVLYEACGLPAVNWEARIGTALLHFVGFESWNRQRMDEWYLRSELNTPKTDKWLLEGVDRKEVAAQKHDLDVASLRKPESKRSRDPLRLHEPKSDTPVHDDEESGDEGEKLAEMERAETEYGTRRSTKYRRKQGR